LYLVDTNVWLELLLNQDRAEDVIRLLRRRPLEELFITDFGFHSIAVMLGRLKKTDDLQRFVSDMFVDGALRLVRLDPVDTSEILEVMGRFGLDFDDAYQYVAAERFNLTLVSFDRDFDRTERGRKTPAEVYPSAS